MARPETVRLQEAILRNGTSLFSAGDVINADTAAELGITPDGFDHGNTEQMIIMENGRLVARDVEQEQPSQSAAQPSQRMTPMTDTEPMPEPTPEPEPAPEG